MMPSRVQIFVKNVSASILRVDELGNMELDPNQEVDIADEAQEHHYADSSAAWRAIFQLERTSLYKARTANPPKIAVRIVPVHQ